MSIGSSVGISVGFLIGLTFLIGVVILNSYTVLYFMWPFLLMPKIRACRFMMASSSSGGASFFACIVRAGDCVAFKIIYSRVTIGVLIL